jgi:hypothetical protein
MALERGGSGLVLLSDFYANKLPMHESRDYLRNMGALEEEGVPRLVTANYISSPSRCTPFSSFFSVCCPDECEGLVGTIERMVAAPSASPMQLAELVSSLPSETVDAPRNLSVGLRSRLDEIATTHGGRVPLHGRLFKQWMHHAYPRECPYPHVAGTTKPVTQDEWLQMYDHLDNAMASEEEIEKHLSASVEQNDFDATLRWTETEELVAVHEHAIRMASSQHPHRIIRAVFGVMAIASVALPLVRTSMAFAATGPEQKNHMV